MWELFGERGEKKVEYVELIYDLIFVYLLGHCNELLERVQYGFVTGQTLLIYLMATLVILQIWYFSTLYINRYGTNSAADYIGLFVNMYLLYHLAEGIRANWVGYYAEYNISWLLILLNLTYQYYRHLKKPGCDALWVRRHLQYRIRMLLLQVAVILISIPLYYLTGLPLSWTALVFGFVGAVLAEKVDSLVPVNSEHLTERVMLFMVFTFGETIVGIGSYFRGGMEWNTLYYSVAAFLIVAGLFLSYGLLYDKIIDRQRDHIEMWYMMIHIVMILALNNITVSMEFMRDPDVETVSKTVFLTVSFVVYYFFMFLLGAYAKKGYRAGRKFFLAQIMLGAVFAAAMAVCYRNGYLSIAVTVAYVYTVLGLIVARYRQVCREICLCENDGTEGGD